MLLHACLYPYGHVRAQECVTCLHEVHFVFFVYIHIFTMLCRLVLMVMRELFVFFSSSIQEAYHLVWDASIHPQRAGCFELGFSFGTRVSWMS